MHAGVVGPRVAAAVAERVELLDIADGDRCLRRHPVAQADLEGAVRQRIERPERQARANAAFRIGGDENARLLGLHRDDGRGQPHFDRRQMRVGHGIVHAPIMDYSRSSRKGSPSCDGRPGPSASTAAIMRPLRPRMRSAWLTSMVLGAAVADDLRMRLDDSGFVAAGVERAGGDERARRRAADAGIAVHHDRGAAVPALHEADQVVDMILGRMGVAVHRHR